MRQTWIVVAIALGINAIYFSRHKDDIKRAMFSAKLALWMMLGFALLGGLFIAGYALEDPGGTEGAILVASWAVPMVLLSVIAWQKPNIVKPILLIFVALALAANIVTLVFPDQYWTFFNTEGPWLGVGSFAFTVVATVYAYHADRKADRKLAGISLLIVTLVPFFVALISRDPMAALAGGSSAAALTPGFTAGLLMLISAKYQKQN